jgi:hypothetical protein
MWYVAAVVGAAVVGGVITAAASNSAANEAGDAATYAADLQFQAQQDAMARSEAAAGEAAAASMAAAEAMAGATTEAARMNAEAAKYAADQQLAAAQESLALQRQMWEKMQKDMQPYLDSGGKGLNQLSYGLGLSGYENGTTNPTLQSGYLQKAFSEQEFAKNFETTPGYTFRLNEGIKALDRSASSRGNLLSGQQLKGITRFGQDFASNEYQNAYNRAYGNYTQNQEMQYNHLQNLSAMGQNTAIQVGQAGLGYANNAGNTLMGATSAANGYMVNAAGQNANLLVQNAQYAGNQSQYASNAQMQAANAAGQYGINGANALGNAALAKANANASSYQAYGQIGNSLANSLGNYYSNTYNPGSSGYNYYQYNPSAFSGYNSGQWAGTSGYSAF